MKNREKSIFKLKLEILELKDQIQKYRRIKPALHRRLKMILNKKENKLDSWLKGQ